MPDPLPISQYIIKVHSRCDLACDHCYMYEHADQSWRRRPKSITAATVSAAASRIAEHASAHDLPQVHIVLHGGEPLLLGARQLREVLAEIDRAVSSVTLLRLGMQSNGVLLTEEICDLLLEYGVRVGISLDGDAEDNDRHRRFRDGSSSHGRVLAALELLRRPEYREVYGGVLCTVDVRNDPIRVYEVLLKQEPPRIDFLLPHATWDAPPLRPDGMRTPYAEWLQRIHERWRRDGMPVSIRMFESLEALGNGGRSGSEAFGLDPADLVVIETDGAWEQVDSLKVAYDGAAATYLTVFDHSVDEVSRHPGIAARQQGVEQLCGECQRCPVVRQCGGGLYAHRYQTGRGFDNPSVYCADLLQLITSLPGGAPDRVPNQPMTPELLADLATGLGSAATIETLAAAQRHLTLSLLKAIGRRIARADSIARAGWIALNRLHEHAEHVLIHPFVRAWAVRCLRELEAGSAPSAAYLASIAATAALRSGSSLDITVPSADGVINLPGLGRVVHSGLGEVTALSISQGSFSVADERGRIHTVRPEEPSEVWQPLRRMALSGVTIALEDVDTFRDCYETPPSGRLSDEEAAGWQKSLAAAVACIERDAAGQGPTIGAALLSVVPLHSDLHRSHSATYRESFGAIAMTRSSDPDGLAEVMIHELQHVKLGAVLDYCDLVAPGFARRVSVPWRSDPRPVEGALQGTYAHLGVAGMYRARLQREPESAARYHTFRQWTLDGIAAMLASGGLTPWGTQFVDLMAQTVRAWEIAA